VIVVDTSALMAIVMKEPMADACSDCLAIADEVLISAATLTETLIVSARGNRHPEMMELIEELGLTVVDLSEALATDAAEAYRTWGKSFHRAGLNFGDCFAYALANQQECPLLFIGDDFSQTDIVCALPKS
jgi:ribonuclease VapC